MPTDPFEELFYLIREGEQKRSIEEAKRLLDDGISKETIIVEGLERVMRMLDQKCTVNQFNLLEIMLAGRAIAAVLTFLYPQDAPRERDRGTVVLATLEGDVHDMGRNLVNTIFSAHGYRVIDAGRNCSIPKLLQVVQEQAPIALGISGLLTLVVPAVKSLRQELEAIGHGHVKIIAGGAALKQSSAEALHVDFVAESVFDGLHYLQDMGREKPVAPFVKGRQLTSLDNVLHALRFEKTEYPPVVPQIFAHTAVRAGVTVREYRRSGEVVASCQLSSLATYGHDAVFAMMDLSVEAEALGADIEEPANAYANIVTRPLENLENLDLLEIPDPEKAGRMPEMLKALRILRKETAEKVPVLGCVLGPTTLAMQLLGLEKALFLAHDEPEKYSAILDFCMRVCQRFASAQISAGAHIPILVDPFSSPAVLPPELFRRYSLPRLRTLLDFFSQAGAAAKWLYIVGPITPILPDIPASGANLVNIDYCVNAEIARDALPRICLDGNITPMAFVEKSPSDIAQMVRELKDIFHARGGWIVSSGCEIPPEARPENIAALVQTLRSGG